jgi:hypothetical protein
MPVIRASTQPGKVIDTLPICFLQAQLECTLSVVEKIYK